VTNTIDKTTCPAPPVSQATSEPDTGAGGSGRIEDMAVALMERARADGVNLVGPGGLWQGLAKGVLESALEAELYPGSRGGLGASGPVVCEANRSNSNQRLKSASRFRWHLILIVERDQVESLARAPGLGRHLSPQTLQSCLLPLLRQRRHTPVLI
jgi:hypothetical protein